MLEVFERDDEQLSLKLLFNYWKKISFLKEKNKVFFLRKKMSDQKLPIRASKI